MKINTALAQGIVRCHDCGSLSKQGKKLIKCRLCGSPLHSRQPHSVQKTLAYLLSAYLLYIPANIFPIMTVTKLGVGEPHTIIGGIIALINSGMLPVALLVLVASLLVPLLKLIGLSLLLVYVRRGWTGDAFRWTLMYRVISFVGRWSMLDIFMISILVALVDMGGISKVLAGPAATAFGAVVVLTMLATKSFDPRLIWDNQTNHE